MKPTGTGSRKEGQDFQCPRETEEGMRGMGTVLLTGAAAIVIWKIMAGMVVGLLGLALKVAMVLLVVYFLLNVFNGRKKEEE